MKKKVYIIVCTTLLLVQPGCYRPCRPCKPIKKPKHVEPKAQSLFVTSYSIQDITTYLSPCDYSQDTLIIFDIDNTIVEPIDECASDQAFYAMYNYHKQQGISDKEALKIILPTFFALHEKTELVPVEPITSTFINNLQKKHLSVIALTARSCTLMESTVSRLKSLGIDFSETDINTEDLDLSLKDYACLRNGIIFVGNNDKGDVLIKFFDTIKYRPKKIIFIDDKEKNINAVKRVAKERNIPFIGLRYAKLDQKVKAFANKATFNNLLRIYKVCPVLKSAGEQTNSEQKQQ